MADINVERKGGAGWLWWVVGLLALALVVWGIAELLETDEAEVAEVVETVPMETADVTPVTTPEPIAQGDLCVAQALSEPATYLGQSLGTCELEVTDVPTDRGFWVEEDGQRIFALIIDDPAEEPLDINPGQTITMSEAVLRDQTSSPEVQGDALDDDTQRIIDQEADYFLVVDESNIDIMSPA